MIWKYLFIFLGLACFNNLSPIICKIYCNKLANEEKPLSKEIILKEIDIINQLRKELKAEKTGTQSPTSKEKESLIINTREQIKEELQSIQQLKESLNIEVEEIRKQALHKKLAFNIFESFSLDNIFTRNGLKTTQLKFQLSGGYFQHFKFKVYKIANPLSILVVFFNPIESNMFDFIPVSESFHNTSFFVYGKSKVDIVKDLRLMHENKSGKRYLKSMLIYLHTPFRYEAIADQGYFIIDFFPKKNTSIKGTVP